MSDENNVITFRLNGYWFHALLEELEYDCRIVNRDTRIARRLYEELARQAGQEVTFEGWWPGDAIENKPVEPEPEKATTWPEAAWPRLRGAVNELQ